MKKCFPIILIMLILLSSCASAEPKTQIAATTLPVYEFTLRLCSGTDLSVSRVITENVSCLHDYTLKVDQMRTIEGAELVVLNGAGLEDFMNDALADAKATADSSVGIQLCEAEPHDHEHGHESNHSHEQDPHIWLSPQNAKVMSANICEALIRLYPRYEETFRKNLSILLKDLDALQKYGEEKLATLSCRDLITFHDGFHYLAESFDLTVIRAVEEESGSEASAAELIELVKEVRHHDLPAIFTEINGSVSAANIISAETGTPVFELDMAMSGDSYFDAMYRNIDTLWEALQ